MTKLKAHSFVLISSILWGITFPLSKYVLDYLAPEQLGFIRYFSGAVIMFAYLLLTKKNIKVEKDQIWFLFYTGVLAFFGYAYFEVKSLSYISSGVVSLFIGIIPVITISIEVFLRRRKLKLKTLLVIGLAMLGIYLVIKEELSLGGDIKGYIFMFFAIIAWIIYLFKAVEIKLDPFVIIAYQFAFASIFHLIGFIYKLDSPMVWNSNVLLIILYLVISSTVICYLLYFVAARFLGAGIVSLYDNLVFIIGFISSAIFFNSSMTANIWISFVLILTSIGLSLTLEVQKH